MGKRTPQWICHLKSKSYNINKKAYRTLDSKPLIIEKNKGFALVEVVISIVLLSGCFLVFLEALSQTKGMQAKSQIKTIQSILLSNKINEIRANGFDNSISTNTFITSSDYPSLKYKITVSYVDDQINHVNYESDFKLIELDINHISNSYPALSDKFIIANIL